MWTIYRAFPERRGTPVSTSPIMHDEDTADTHGDGASTIHLGGGVTVRVLEIPALDALAFGIWFEGALLAVVDEPVGEA